jgi:hypothetical protein
MSTRVCGVSVSGGYAIFVILEGLRNDFEMIENNIKKIKLDDDTNQDQIKAFYTEVEDFLKQNQIDSVFMKKGNTSGKFSASARSFKMEALIQLMPYDVELIAAQTIAAFDKKNEIPVEKYNKLYKYQYIAFKLGFYGLGE